MKILMLSADYLPNIGGIAAHIYNLAKALIGLGHKVVVINPLRGTEQKLEVSKEEGIVVYRISRPTWNSRLGRLWSTNRSTYWGIEKARREFGAFDILHQHDHRSSTVAAYLRKDKIPWIWTNHSSGFLSDFDKPLKRRLIRWAYSGTAGIIAVSDELDYKSRRLWHDDDTRKFAYIPNGVDAQKFSPQVRAVREKFGLSPSDFVVLCPRRMVEKNGIIYLARATSILLQTVDAKDLKVVFLGDEPSTSIEAYAKYVAEVKATLASAYVKGMIRYFGNVPMKQMPEVNALADVVVVPSLMEAVSLSALEAMATRKPLIATEVGGLPEIVKHEETGLLVEPRNPEALAKAILRLRRDTPLRDKIAAGGYDLATTKYSWQAVAEQTLEFYRQVLGQ